MNIGSLAILECHNIKKKNQRTSNWSDKDESNNEKDNDGMSNAYVMALEEANKVRYQTCNKCNTLQNFQIIP